MNRTILSVLFIGLLQAPAVSEDAPDSVKTALTIGQVGRLLKEMGCDPKQLTPDVWQVSIVRDGWKVNIMISLASGGERLWMESKFAEISEPEMVPTSAWLKLLTENERIGPAYFAFDKSDHRIHLYQSLNNVALTPGIIKKELDGFDATVRKTQRLWRIESFAPLETLPIPREVDNRIKQVSELDGEWRIVRIESRGDSLTEDMIAELNPKMVIRGNAATIRTGLQPERQVRIKVDPEQKPKTIDIIDENNRTEAGIFVMEAGLLTICVAAAGEDRPRQFITDPKNKLWLLVMKRSE